MLSVMSESPVANGRGGDASTFSSSSESSITLRFVIWMYNLTLQYAAVAFDGQNNVDVEWELAAETRTTYKAKYAPSRVF